MSMFDMTTLLILLATPLLGGTATTDGKSESSECFNNKDCLSDKLCVEGKCINPCLLNLCEDAKSCKVTNHIPVCSCSGFSGALTANKYPDGLRPQSRREKKFQLQTIIKVNWYQAVASCNAMNMRLVTIDNQREYETLVRTIRQLNLGPVDFWTAATDLTEQGTYLWFSTGKPMAYFNFVQGEPNHWNNGGEVERCVELTQGIDYKMNDDKCSTLNYYACEYFE